MRGILVSFFSKASAGLRAKTKERKERLSSLAAQINHHVINQTLNAISFSFPSQRVTRALFTPGRSPSVRFLPRSLTQNMISDQETRSLRMHCTLWRNTSEEEQVRRRRTHNSTSLCLLPALLFAATDDVRNSHKGFADRQTV